VITTVRAVEPVGPYRLVSLQQTFDVGLPGQFHMLRAVDGDAFLGRPLSAMRVGRGLVDYLCDVRGPGLAAVCREGAPIDVQGPFGKGFDLEAVGDRPVLCAGGIGIAVMPWLAERLPGARLVAGFRTADHARAAELVPGVERRVAIEPVLVTDPLAE